VQLAAPVRVVTVLKMESLSEGRRERDLATVFAHGASQDAKGVIAPLAERRVIPACDGAGRDADIAPGHRMGPGLFGEGADRRMERSACRR
jgi:hypothetical protein